MGWGGGLMHILYYTFNEMSCSTQKNYVQEPSILCGQDGMGVNMQELNFPGNWMTSTCAENHVCLSHYSWVGVGVEGSIYKNIVLPWIEWNIQICTQNPCSPIPIPHGDVGSIYNFVATNKNRISRCAQKFLYQPTTPHQSGDGWVNIHRNLLARSWLKCPNLHRKVIVMLLAT